MGKEKDNTAKILYELIEENWCMEMKRLEKLKLKIVLWLFRLPKRDYYGRLVGGNKNGKI